MKSRPGKILTRALLLGMASTVYLAKARVTEETRHLFEGGKDCKGIKRIHKEALEEYYRLKQERRPNADPLQRREGSIVRSFQKITFNTSVPYGNTEVTRKRRREDRKYINSLADYYGACLRDLGAEEFLFAPPMRTYTEEGKLKWVYPGNVRTPEYVPTHTAPELDFVDIIRSHGTELIRQCLKYSVPMKDARKHLDTLIERLTPYLEAVYIGQRKIEDGFVRGSVKRLRELTLEIRAIYGGVTGRRQSITEEVAEKIRLEKVESCQTSDEDNLSKEETLKNSFFSFLADRCDVESHPEWNRRVEKLREHIKKKRLNRADVEHIERNLLEHARQLGTSFHDFISNSEFTARPFSLFGVLRYGDEMVNDEIGFLFTCEVYVADGKGRVDLLLFRRKELRKVDDSQPEYVWEPCMLVEIKTKCFFNLDLYAKSTKSKDRAKRVIEHTHELRRSNSEEWREVIDSIPNRYEHEQLNAYEKEVLEEYRKHNRRDSDLPTSLMKAVLVVDMNENWETLRDNIKNLILQVYHNSKGATLKRREHYSISLNNRELRMGLVVFSDTLERKTSPVKSVTHFNPFSRSGERKHDRKFTLYLTVSGKGSPAESAARIAARWHGLELIYSRTKETGKKVVWFDLSGELDNWRKRKRVFRYGLHSNKIRHFLRRDIRFTDLSETVASHIQGRENSKRIREEIQVLLKGIKDPFIVFTGSDRIRKTLTKERTPQFDEMVALLLDSVPDKASVLWFDRPVPTSHTSQRYDTRSIAPFYSDSVWMDLVDEIIYNVPTAPFRYGSYVPVEDDIRWLVVESDGDVDISQVLIPPLFKWGERFRPDSERDVNITRRNMHFLRSSYSNMKSTRAVTDERAVLELIPHLKRFYDTGSGRTNNEESLRISSEWLFSRPSDPKPFLSRIDYTPYQVLTQKKKKASKKEKEDRVIRLEPLEKINHAREYRTTRLYGRPRKVTTRPPHISLLRYNVQALNVLHLRELSGIRRVLKILRTRWSGNEEPVSLLDTLIELVDKRKINRTPTDGPDKALRAVRVVLETHSLTDRFWDQLRVMRSRVPQGLSPEQEKVLKQLVDQQPDILLTMGNQLFLMLFAAVHEAGVLDMTGNIIGNLWESLVPWQLVSLGYEPEYPEHIQTGRSVLHRPQLIDRLFRRAKALKVMRMGEEAHSLQFGKAAVIEEENRTSLFLTFQTRPESRDMNTIFLRLPSGTEGQTMEILRGLCRERPFWGESDPTRLSRLSDTVDLDKGVDIMVATHRGVQGLWVFDDAEQRWNAIGRLDYYKRRRETVTLLMSVTLREDSALDDLSRERVREKPAGLRSAMEVGLGIVSAVFRNCEAVKCRLSLDDEEKMFRLSFHRQEKGGEVAHLLIRRTVDVIEVLRRPDFQCEQVIVDGYEMVWNRFNDIEYVDGANLVRPWVERREPFKTIDLSLPKTSDQFIKMERKGGLKLTVRHDPKTCPLCTVSKDELRRRSERHTKDDVSEYLRWIDGEKGQPEELISESIYRHGVCWRVGLQTEEELPDVVKQLETIVFSGPALATLLESGCISYESERDGWVLFEFTIPRSEELPREFRESIHLMRWRRETAVVPGQYILEEWKPDISIGIDKIRLGLESQVTGETQTHSVLAKRGDQMNPAKLSDLLEREMQGLVERKGLKDDERLRGLIQELIEEVAELVEESRPTSLKYEGVGIVSLGYSGKALEAIFTSSDGDLIGIQVTQAIHVYLNWVEFSGGVDSEVIDTDVVTVLSQYDISEEVLEEVIRAVKTELEDQGVIFREVL